MCIATFMTLTPLAPWVYNTEDSNPGTPYGIGGLHFYGGVISYFNPYRLVDQYNANEVVLGCNPVPLSDQTIEDIWTDTRGRCTMHLYWYGYNISVENQYLMIFHLNGISGNPTAQFFVGTEFVREEEINGAQQVALLMDVPSNDNLVHVYVRLASDIHSATLGFKGVDIFLL